MSGGRVSTLYHGSGRVCVCVCVYVLKSARVDGWQVVGVCVYAVDGLRLCGHVFNLYVWGGCVCVRVRSVCGWCWCYHVANGRAVLACGAGWVVVCVANVYVYCVGGVGEKTNKCKLSFTLSRRNVKDNFCFV